MSEERVGLEEGREGWPCCCCVVLYCATGAEMSQER